MPVIRPRRPQWVAEESRENLVDQLVQELRRDPTAGSPSTSSLPVIFEVPVNRDHSSLHVIVVWDSWDGVSPEDRAAIITEAYERFDESGNPGEPIAPRITIAIGATAEEAVIQMNLLPYRIRPTIVANLTDRDDIQQKVRQAMWAEGAIEFVADRPTLAFPSRQMRDEAFRRLTEKVPEGYWHLYDE
jgi:hypothetical protein